MPGYRSHLIGGVVAATPLSIIFGLQASSFAIFFVWFGLALAGSLFPDIDTKSKGQKWFYRSMFVILIALLYFRKFDLFSAFALVSVIPLVVNHRSTFHRFWFVLFVPFCIAGVFAFHMPSYSKDAIVAGIFFAAGAISHLFLDFGPKRMFR